MRQGKQGWLKEANGEKDLEQDREPKLEVEKDLELGQKLEQVREGCWVSGLQGQWAGPRVDREAAVMGPMGVCQHRG